MKSLFFYLSVFIFPTAAIAQCDSSSWMSYDTSNSGLINNQVNMIVIGANDILWAGQGTGYWPSPSGLSSFDGVTWSYYNEINSGLPADAIFSLCPGDSGNIWVGTNMGLAMFDGITWTVYDTSNSPILDNTIYAIVVDLTGKLWIGTYYGISVFDGSTWTSYTTSNSLLPNNTVSVFAVDHLNNIWIGTESGAAKYNQTTNSWTLFNISNSNIPSNSISSIAEDHNYNVWFGFGLGFDGVVEYDGVNWNYHYPFNTWVSYNSIKADVFNNIWVGTRCEGLYYYSGTQWIHCTPPTQVGFDCASINYAIAFDSNNNVWYGDQHAGVWTIANPTGIEEAGREQQCEIHLSPNPATTELNVSLNNYFSSRATVTIYNSLMQLISSERMGNTTEQVDVSNLAEGMYIVQVTTDKCSALKKIIIQK